MTVISFPVGGLSREQQQRATRCKARHFRGCWLLLILMEMTGGGVMVEFIPVTVNLVPTLWMGDFFLKLPICFVAEACGSN